MSDNLSIIAISGVGIAIFGLVGWGCYALFRRKTGALRVLAGVLMALCGLFALLCGICGFIGVNI